MSAVRSGTGSVAQSPPMPDPVIYESWGDLNLERYAAEEKLSLPSATNRRRLCVR